MLSLGSTGAKVTKLIELLILNGYQLEKKDTFDLDVAAAVFSFQVRASLFQDGIAGPKTIRALSIMKYKSSEVDPFKWYIKDVPYVTRRGTERPGSTATDCLAMVLAHHGQKPSDPEVPLEDELYAMLKTKTARTYINKMCSWAKQQGLNEDTTPQLIRWLAMELGYEYAAGTGYLQALTTFGSTHGPIIMPGSFAGFNSCIVLLGEVNMGPMIVHDPLGNWNNGYHVDDNGQNIIYPRVPVLKVLRGHASSITAHQIKKK